MITLVIIGVIAAITVPTLIAKYHDQQLKTQFKKTYSTVSQAASNIILLDYSGNIDCYAGVGGIQTKVNQASCMDFFKNLAKKLNVIRICNGNALSEGCLPMYSDYPAANGSCQGYTQSEMNNTNTVYVLGDGQILIPYGNGRDYSFLVDINGKKGPNKPGYDLFGFAISKSEKRGTYLSPGTNCQIASGGRSTTEMLKYVYGSDQ